MRLFLDECVPRKVKFLLADRGHECETVRDAGFSGKKNGELLRHARGPAAMTAMATRRRSPRAARFWRMASTWPTTRA